MTGRECGNPRCSARCDDPICWPCTDHLTEILGRLPWLLAQLAEPMPRLGDRGRRPHHAPIPYATRANALTEEIDKHLRQVRDRLERRGIRYLPAWATHHADFIGPLRETDVRSHADSPPPTASEIARWLRARVTDFRQLATAGADMHTIEKHSDGAERAINRTIPPEYRGPCPQCRQPLYGDRDDKHVTCPACGATHLGAALPERHLADLGQRLFRAAELLKTLTMLRERVPQSTFFEWVRTGKIHAAIWEHPDGTHTQERTSSADIALYRLDDVRRLRAGLPPRRPRGKTA